MTKSDRDRLIALAKARGILTAKQVAGADIHSQQITRLVSEGTLDRVSSGLYRLADYEITENHGLVLACGAAPKGVICLISALVFHEIGTQLPAHPWIAIERGSRAPRLSHLGLRVVRFSGDAFHHGIETHIAEGRQIRVYSVAKTLADMFKARNRVGVDVLMEALREAWRDRRFTMSDLYRAARVCRVERVIQPYLEGVIH